jgi:hypothetical protein
LQERPGGGGAWTDSTLNAVAVRIHSDANAYATRASALAHWHPRSRVRLVQDHTPTHAHTRLYPHMLTRPHAHTPTHARSRSRALTRALSIYIPDTQKDQLGTRSHAHTISLIRTHTQALTQTHAQIHLGEQVGVGRAAQRRRPGLVPRCRPALPESDAGFFWRPERPGCRRSGRSRLRPWWRYIPARRSPSQPLRHGVQTHTRLKARRGRRSGRPAPDPPHTTEAAFHRSVTRC